MLEPTPRNKSTPNWVWLSFVPLFGSMAIVYAGSKARTSKWMYLGAGVFTVSLFTVSSGMFYVAWLAQIYISFHIKEAFLRKTADHPELPGFHNLAQYQAMPSSKAQVDINSCSKDELVRVLGLPIVYANDIESLKNEGYIFTHVEELSEIAGLPESYIGKLAGKVIFTYNSNKELECSWQRLNVMSIDELVMAGLGGTIAQKIVAERENNGEYRSIIDIKRRTSIPFHSYKIVVQHFPYS
jgi:DNA uptake protein ComE-like DNA-binding protein